MVDDKIEIIQVEKDILDFLKAIYFGPFFDPLQAASSRAYRDMSRTIRFHGLSKEARLELREKVNEIFREEIKKLIPKNITCSKDFDEWHHSLCDRIKQVYSDKDIKLTYGHTQKWINMTIKYLYVLEENSFDGIFKYLHIPLDNYVFDAARDSLSLQRPKVVWSSWDDYNGQYLEYQELIREKIVCETPLRWEFRHWIKAIRRMKNSKNSF